MLQKLPNRGKIKFRIISNSQLLCIVTAIFCTLYLSECFQMKQLSRTTVSRIINEHTTYTFVFDRTISNSGLQTTYATNAVSSTATIYVQFPIEFIISGSQKCIKIDIVSGSASYSPTSFTCSFSGNKIIFNGALTGLSDLYIKTVTVVYGDVLNPSPAVKSGQFLGQIGIDEAVPSSGTFIQFTAASFSSCALTFSNGGYVNSASAAIFTLTPLNKLNVSSSIKITFPAAKVWQNDITQTILPVSTGTMSCSSGSNVQSNLVCTGNYLTFTVQVTSIFASIIDSGQQFSFQINNFISPPTLQYVDVIKITSLTNGFEVDTCNTKVSGLQPKKFQALKILPISGTMKVNEQVGIAINMTFSDIVDQYDTYRITFPSILGVSSTYFSTSGTPGSPTLTGQVLTIQMNTAFQFQNLAGTFFVINFYTMTAPPSIKQSDTILVEVLRNGFQKTIDTTTVKALASTITGSVAPQASLISSSTLYTFTIVLKDKLSSTGWLQLIFPSTVTLPSTLTSVTASGIGIQSSPTVAVNLISNKVTVTSLSSGSGINVQTITITLGPIINPGSTKITDKFTVNSYYQTGSQYLTAIGLLDGITATPGVMKTPIPVAKLSDVVLALTSYSLTFSTSYVIPQNGVIKLQIPNDIKIDLTNLPTNCFQQVNPLTVGSTKIAATCTGSLNAATNKYEIRISSIALTNSLPVDTSIAISLQNICTNPDSTRNIIGFSLATATSDGFAIQSAASGISTKASTPATCLNVVVSRLSKVNSVTTNYMITLRQPSTFLGQSYLLITFPPQLQILSTSICTDGTGAITYDCSVSLNVVTVKFPNTLINSLTLFSVIVTNVVNTATFQPVISQFTVLTKTPDNINQYCTFSFLGNITNNVASPFLSITGSYTPQIFYQITSLIITFKPSIRIIPSYIIVSLATQLKVQTLSCSFQGIIAADCEQTSPNTIKITGTFNPNQMQFTIGGVRAPKFSSTTPQFSSVSSFSSTNFKIDQSINLIRFSVKCTLPCKTCPDANLAQCQSCYQDTAISTEIYLASTLKMCYSVCPNGLYKDATTIKCQACSQICKTCVDTAANCLQCVNPSATPYLNQLTPTTATCVDKCPSLFYPNTLGVCTACQTPCKQCTSKTACTSCDSTHFMDTESGVCVTTCPPTKTIANVDTRVCDKCSSVCDTCSGTIDNCVTCSATSVSWLSTCLDTCPPPLVIKGTTCSTCDTKCKQCSVNYDKCTKCDTASAFKYLYGTTCLGTCPETYYNDIINGVCKECQLLNIGCKNCSTISTCLSCDATFIFLSSKCYPTPPTGYYNDNGIAKPCTGDCATCVDLPTKCTSCKTLNLDGNTCTPTCLNTYAPENKICVPCEPPCLTCSNIKANCTSCDPSITPTVFLNNYFCSTTCPDYTYKSLTSNLCAPCSGSCLKCISDIQCLSCINGFFLLGTQCLGLCTKGYVGINKQCISCDPPCETCQTSTTRCLTCKSSFYLYNSSAPTCVSDCSTVGLYPDTSSQICTGCKAPCVTCSTTSTTCTACSQPLILYDSKCIAACSQGYYSTSTVCVICPQQCKTCTSSNICQKCQVSYYLFLNASCVSKCPDQYPVITVDGTCSKCTDKACDVCLVNDYCDKCLTPYFLYLGKCVERCPTSYNQTISAITNFRQCVYDPTVNKSQIAIQNVLSSKNGGGNLFPVPFTIAAAFVGIATIMSKFQNPFTFVSGVLYSLWGLLEWGAVGVSLWFFYQENGWSKIQFYIIGGSLAFLYILNFISLFVQNIYLTTIINFNKWVNLGSHRCFYYFASIVGFLATHKFKNIIFSKMFNFDILKARLDTVQQFRVFNVFSFLSFLSSAGVLFGLGLILGTYPMLIDQKLMAYIDALILTFINILLAILNSKKDQSYFQQKTEEGYVIGKRIQDIDQLLYGGCMPPMTQEKFDHNQATGTKLMDHHYKHLPSQLSQDSVRNISIQVDSILGQQSRISHFNSEQISNLNLFEQAQVSVQYDQPPRMVEDKSINMTYRQNNEISIQMDNISQNQISIQVSKQNADASIQYAPNLFDKEVGISRYQRQISIQANPLQEEVSVQYSAKPIFVNIDQEYNSEGQNALGQSTLQNQSSISKSKNSFASASKNQSSFNHGIKRPDNKLAVELELDVDEKLKIRQAQLKRLQEQRKREEIMQAVANFQKKKPQEQQIQEQKFIKNQGNNFGHNQINKLFDNEDTIKNQTQSIMDSKYDLMNLNRQRFSSNESRVQKKSDVVNNSRDNSQEGEHTEQQFIQMLSGRKATTNQNQQGEDSNPRSKQSNFENGIRLLKVESTDQLEDSNQISLNITEQMQPNDQKLVKGKANLPAKFKFQNRNQAYDSGSQQFEDGNHIVPLVPAQLSNQYTKSISTKHMTMKWRPPLPRGLQSEELIDTSQDIQNSFTTQNGLTRDIINGPIQPSINSRINLMRRPNDQSSRISPQQSHEYFPKTNLTDFLQQKSRNLKSATLTRGRQIPTGNQRHNDNSSEDQDEEYEIQQKQEPLPQPEDYEQDFENNQNQLEFGQSQKVLVSPLETEQYQIKPAQSRQHLPKGIKFKTNPRKKIQNQNKSLNSKNKAPTGRSKSKQRQKPVYKQLLNPSTSAKNINLNKQLRKEEKKAQSRKKNLELMEGMLQRPSNSKKGYSKQQNSFEQPGKSTVQKIYLNKPNNLMPK